MAEELNSIGIDLHREAGFAAFLPGIRALRASRSLIAVAVVPEIDPEVREDIGERSHG
jgi:hypothetical protein